MNAAKRRSSSPPARPRLTAEELRLVALVDRVITAISHGWPRGLAYLAVLRYCAQRATKDLNELMRTRRRLQRRLGSRGYCLARSALKSDTAIAAWTSSPAAALGGRRPQDILATPIGRRRIERLLRNAPEMSRSQIPSPSKT